MPEPAGLDEFGRIARYLAPLARAHPGAFGLTDDAATLSPATGHELVVTADALVEGVHFRPEDPPDRVARKMLRVNVSDLAAMGARPLAYVMTMALPARCGDDWLAAFASGLAEDQEAFGVALIGGDSVATPGPITLSVTAFGEVPLGLAIRRAGAHTGEALFVTGTIGDGALGLVALRDGLPGLTETERAFLAGRYQLPQPRLTAGAALRGIATAMLDVSDGLLADAGHIAQQSSVRIEIDRDAVPLSDAARRAVETDPGAWESILGGGDDYELLFTAPHDAVQRLRSGATSVPITAIGRVLAGNGVAVLDAAGRSLTISRTGYRHV